MTGYRFHFTCIIIIIIIIGFFGTLNFVHLSLTLFNYDFPIETLRLTIFFKLVSPSKTVPPPVVPLLQIQFAAILIYSDGHILTFIQIRY